MKEPEITLVCATLGRPSLKALCECVKNQTHSCEFLVVFDGSEACDAGLQYLPSGTDYIVTHEGPPKGPSGEIVCARALGEITTKFIGRVDDDCLFHPDHVKYLMEGFSAGAGFVATRRVYVDREMNPLAKEDPLSELVDTNCSAFDKQLLVDAMKFAEDNWKLKVPFFDRNIQAYLFGRGIKPRIIPVYTVAYRVSRDEYINWYRGKVAYETIASSILVTGAWKPEDGAPPLSDLNYLRTLLAPQPKGINTIAAVEMIDCSAKQKT